jgi:hypothetical protein
LATQPLLHTTPAKLLLLVQGLLLLLLQVQAPAELLHASILLLLLWHSCLCSPSKTSPTSSTLMMPTIAWGAV